MCSGTASSCDNGYVSGNCNGCNCIGGWEGASCSVCNMTCDHGSPGPRCLKCLCDQGFFGNTCQYPTFIVVYPLHFTDDSDASIAAITQILAQESQDIENALNTEGVIAGVGSSISQNPLLVDLQRFQEFTGLDFMLYRGIADSTNASDLNLYLTFEIGKIGMFKFKNSVHRDAEPAVMEEYLTSLNTRVNAIDAPTSTWPILGKVSGNIVIAPADATDSPTQSSTDSPTTAKPAGPGTHSSSQRAQVSIIAIVVAITATFYRFF